MKLKKWEEFSPRFDARKKKGRCVMSKGEEESGTLFGKDKVIVARDDRLRAVIEKRRLRG